MTSIVSTVRRFFRVQGIVQGVGFRPFVARTARQLGLAGHVENTTRGVEIEVQGPPERIEAFRETLLHHPPPMARILSCHEEPRPSTPEEGFRIRASREDPVAAAVIPPDIATCPACLRELRDPGDRRFGYPFLNCTDCGPRYTIIAGIPYDRARTSMAGFRMCPACRAEYDDPESRRFHAQPNACPACGPRLELRDAEGRAVPGDPLAGAVEVLARGGILALLGLGGFHLACDPFDEGAVAELRRRKHRPAKPFALMAADLGEVRRLVQTDPAAEALLAGPEAPILLLPARGDAGVAPSVAPGQDRLGVFLPYTPLHHLLFARGGFRALVMTSGNRSDEPILATWDEARARLSGVADAFLVHDRPILHRVDDSVVKATPRGPVILRRARGHAPAPVPLPNPDGRVVLGLGAELANTVCVVRGEYAYPSPHLGDLKNPEVEAHFRRTVEHLLELLRVEPDLVVRDLHPAYRSSRYAEEWAARGVEVVAVQHHEAHAAAVMAEHGAADEEAVVLALDGLGLGPDGTIWGGEVLAGRPGSFRQAGHLRPVPQPGGDRAAKEPWRMAASHLRAALGPAWQGLELGCFGGVAPGVRAGLDRMMEQGVNAPLTSSCGRLFDAAAAILGFRGPMRYSAQAPMELEALAARADREEALPEGVLRQERGAWILDPAPFVVALAERALAGADRRRLALGFHRALARLFARAAQAVGSPSGRAYLAGGCLQNAIFLDALCAELAARGLEPRWPRLLPPNDGAISYGQCVAGIRGGWEAGKLGG